MDLSAKYAVSPDGKTVIPANALQDGLIKLEQAEQLRRQGKLDRAFKICEGLLRQHPDYMGALHTLGLIHADRNNFQRALDCLVRAVMLNPRSWQTLTALSGVYLKLDASEMAAQALEQARAIKPQEPSILVTLGEIYRREREYELAQHAYRQALALDDTLTEAALGLGKVCSYIGEDAEAAAVLERLFARGTRTLDVLGPLANLPPALVKLDVLAELDRVVRDPGFDQAEFDNSVAFIRARTLEHAGRHDEAWQCLGPANRTLFLTRRKELGDLTSRLGERLTELRARAAAVTRSAPAPGEPISLFIVGSSRSGKTTLEKLVATLDGVKRGHENPAIENAIRRAMQTAGLLTSNLFEHLPPMLYPSCLEIYREEVVRRAGSAKIFTNTHPARVYDATLIASSFPNVRFICVKRDLEDTVWRIYQQKYETGNIYSYDLTAARDYVIWYHQMIDALAQKLPTIVRVINYEDMIADPAAARGVAAELCGVAAPSEASPVLGDDRGCAEPYRGFLTAALAG